MDLKTLARAVLNRSIRPRAASIRRLAEAALAKGAAQLERLIKAKPEAEKIAARKRYEADPRVASLRSIAAGKQTAAPTPPAPKPTAGARVGSVTTETETRAAPATRAPSPPPSVETPMGRAAMLLSQAAQSLLAAASTMRRGGVAGGVAPASYDRGLNIGSRASYANHVISNDNSRRVQAETHIGSIMVQGGRDAESIANGLGRALRARSLAYMGASGLD